MHVISIRSTLDEFDSYELGRKIVMGCMEVFSEVLGWEYEFVGEWHRPTGYHTPYLGRDTPEEERKEWVKLIEKEANLEVRIDETTFYFKVKGI